MLNHLISLSDRLNTFYEGHDQMDSSSTRQIVEMTDQIRKSCTTLAELEGEIESEKTVTINQFNSLKFFIFEQLCLACKEKILEQFTEVVEV